jgi:hypothetical protein
VQTWRQEARVVGDTFGGSDGASLEMHLEAIIERVWRWIWRPGSWELECRNQGSLDNYIELVHGRSAGYRVSIPQLLANVRI